MSLSVEEGMQQQLGHWRSTLSSGAHRLGWKIGFNAPAIQEKLGLEHSVVGNLTSGTLIGADGSHSLAGADSPLLEPEIVIEMGRDGSVAGLGVAAEVVDMPGPPPPEEVGETIAANIFHRAVAIGSSSGESADGVEAVITVNGEEVRRGDAGATDIAATVALVSETLEAAGESLEAGDRIIAGTITPPAPLSPGDRATVDLGPLGKLDLTFTH
jgi:2-keto-4-pentenoate hydratase